jgi:peptidoglycan/xylan/chitin deacetylase (PgdA/CDA1 family)
MSEIIFSVDVEEFDIPLEYGQAISMDEQLSVSAEGMVALHGLLRSLGIKATLFTTAFWAESHHRFIQDLSAHYEIASHTYYHDRFSPEHLQASRDTLRALTGQEVAGLRMPRMQNISEAAIASAGYRFDSSLHPTWLPGRYNHLNKPRTPYFADGLWQVPVSVSPVFRIPVFWLSFKNFPLGYYLWLCRTILKNDGRLIFYVHSWEFADISGYKLPGIVNKISGVRLLERLSKTLKHLQRRGSFITHSELLSQLTEHRERR